MITHKDRGVRRIWLIVAIVTILCTACLGCQSQEVKITPEQVDKIHEEIRGNRNILKTITVKISKVQTTMQEIQHGSSSSGGEGDDHIESDIDHTENSIWLMLGYGALLIVGTLLLCGLFIFALRWLNPRYKKYGIGRR